MSRELLYENRSDKFYCRDVRGRKHTLACSPHLHKHLELVCLLEGEVSAVIDSREYLMKGGDVLLAFPNQVHSFICDGSEQYLLFIIDPSLIPEYSDQLVMSLPASPLIPGLLERKPHVEALFRALPSVSGRLGREHPFCETTRRGYLLALFGELFREMSVEPTKASDATVVRQIIDYCMRNYTSDLSLSVLESELHVSKYYISHLFSERMKVRFNDYINSFRVSAACRYLEQSDKSVTEISRLVGFNTLRTFNRAFAKQVGTTPSAYKKSLEGGSVSDSMPL
ncbi:MAG: helix-turn-helix transcriptional regulator [Clostridia bacterium]|nr:helix-turn-helix transcriptional regulator [Clostridia bacterium]